MRLPSSSSLVFASLAISSSSSTLSALAAPAGDPAQAQSGVSAPNNNFNAARRGSISVARSEAVDQVQEARSEGEQVQSVAKRNPVCDLVGMLEPLVGSLAPQVVGLLNPALEPVLAVLCPPNVGAKSESMDAMSVSDNSTTEWKVPSNSSDASAAAPSSEPASVDPSASSSPTGTSSQPPSRRDAPVQHPDAPIDPTTVPGRASQAAQDHTGPITQAAPVKPGDVTSKVGDIAPKPITDAKGDAKNAAPQPVQNGVGTIEGSTHVQVRSHRARRDVPPPPTPTGATGGAPEPPVQPPAQPPAPVQPPVQPPIQPPVQPPVATSTVTSTVTETAAPTSN